MFSIERESGCLITESRRSVKLCDVRMRVLAVISEFDKSIELDVVPLNEELGKFIFKPASLIVELISLLNNTSPLFALVDPDEEISLLINAK